MVASGSAVPTFCVGGSLAGSIRESGTKNRLGSCCFEQVLALLQKIYRIEAASAHPPGAGPSGRRRAGA